MLTQPNKEPDLISTHTRTNRHTYILAHVLSHTHTHARHAPRATRRTKTAGVCEKEAVVAKTRKNRISTTKFGPKYTTKPE